MEIPLHNSHLKEEDIRDCAHQMCSQYFSMLLNVSGYMHDKLALYPWYILGINHYKRLIYKSLNIIALFAHFKGYFHLFCNKKEMS